MERVIAGKSYYLAICDPNLAIVTNDFNEGTLSIIPVYGFV